MYKKILGKISINSILASILLVVIILFTFWNLKSTFFQQDEWLGQGQILTEGWKHVVFGFTPLQLLFATGRPLTRLFGVLVFGNFPLDVRPLAIYSIFFHSVNTLLAFFIFKRIIKNEFFSFFAALFFAVSSVSSQAVTWFGASFGLLPAAACVFLSILLFLFFLEDTKKTGYLYSSFLALIVSFYFKEIGFSIFLLYPFLYFVFHKRRIDKTFFRIFTPVVLFLAIFILYEFLNVTFFTQSKTSISPFFSTNNKNSIISTILINTIMYPLTNLSLMYIPIRFMLSFARWFANIYYSPVLANNPVVVQNIVPEIIALVVSMLLIILCFFIARKKHLRISLIIALIFFFLSLLPYVFIKKGFSYLEPRYYYVTALPSGILLALIGEYILSFFSNKKIGYSILIVLFSYIAYVHVQTVRQDIADQVNIASERKQILNAILSIQPKFFSKTIFYITGDKQFLVPNNYVPFQQGFGYTLQVLYYINHVNIPKQFLENGFLWDLGSEGYQESNGIGFGYFSELDKLQQLLNREHIPANDVVALYYNSTTHKFTRLTKLQ